MVNELQKDNTLLPGGLGSMTIKSSGNSGIITQALENKDGSVTLTITPNKKELTAPVTEDIDHEVVNNKLLDNGKNVMQS